jgi:hypothetical protein
MRTVYSPDPVRATRFVHTNHGRKSRGSLTVSKLELVINLKTAKALDLSLSALG